MVNGNGYVYGYGRKPEYLRWTTTMEHQLFKADPNPPEIPANFNNAAAAAAAGSYAQFQKAPSLNPTGKPITIEAWVTATRPSGVIAARGGPAEGFALILEEGRPSFLIRSDSKLTSVKGPKRIVGGWHHVVGVLTEDKQMRLFVDGQRVGEAVATGLLTKDPAQGMEVGADAASAVGEYETPNSFAGIIDEVRFYLNGTDDAAIAERFKNGSELGNDPRLVVTFDDGTARDFSTYRNNGTMEGGAIVEGKIGKAMQFTARNSVAKNGAAKKGAAANAGANNQAAGAKVGNSLVTPKWANDVPIYVRAMVLAGNKLFIAGPLDIIDEEETFKKLSEKDTEVQELLAAQDQALEGKFSGLLLAVNCDSGLVEQRIELGTLPAWDGMAGANGKLFLSTIDGRLMCFGKE